MKSLYTTIYCLLCFVVTTTSLHAQNYTVFNPTDDETVIKTHDLEVNETESLSLSGGRLYPSSAAPTVARSSGSGVEETPGVLSVSLTGAATYAVPIAVPPGIDGVAPQIAITYNSQGGNGIAGWGWDISGISSITRIPATKYHDGFDDPVDFDGNDRFALDGQRLILKSRGAGLDALYETENYSNLRISIARNVFSVGYPDGSRAGYLQKSRNEYVMTLWKNPQGVTIKYYHSKKNEVLRLDRIEYGANNSIKFKYGTRTRNEQSYIKGTGFVRSDLLNKIEVYGNNKLYRTYTIAHNTNSLGYDRVSSIQEKSGTSVYDPIVFDYDTTDPSSIGYTSSTGIDNSGVEQPSSYVVPLDINGNGKMDFAVVPKPGYGNTLWIHQKRFYSDGYTTATSINAGIRYRFRAAVPTTILDAQHRISAAKALTVIKQRTRNSPEVRFGVYGTGGAGNIGLDYEKVWYTPTYRKDDDSNCNRISIPVPQQYVSGDFNGDGLTDILAIPKVVISRTCVPLGVKCSCPNITLTEKPRMIELDRRKTNNFVTELSNAIDELGYAKLSTGDFNGDGRTDILAQGKTGFTVYTLDDDNTSLVKLWSTLDNTLNASSLLLLGDYNGDGKTDIMITTAYGSKNYRMYVSVGNDFILTTTTHPFSYRKTTGINTNGSLYTYNLIPIDINGDGKTDIIDYHTYSRSGRTDGDQSVFVYYNTSVSDTGVPKFAFQGYATKSGNVVHYPIPIFLSPNQPNRSLEFASISNQWISSFTFSLDHRKDVSLKKVTKGGVSYDLGYRNLDANAQYPIYIHNPDNIYPYRGLRSIPGMRLVSTIERSSGNHPIVKQEYYYKGATTHIDGKGFLGFEAVARSNWHTGNDDRLFTVTHYDPKRMGAVTQQYQMEGFYSFTTPVNYITKTDYKYIHNLSTSKVFKITPESVTIQNKLQGTSITKNYVFDSYNNLTRETVNYSGHGSTVTETIYENSLTGRYYMGRPKIKKQTTTIGGDSFSTEEQYDYTNFLVTEKRTKGNGTQFNTTSYAHDRYGNITKVTVTPYGEASRTSSFTYDPSRRFIEKSTDIEGLETTYTYDQTTGMVLTATDPYNRTTTNKYDAFDRLENSLDFLGNAASTSYIKSGGAYTVNTKLDDGSATSVVYDPLKRMVSEKVKGFKGTWIETQYKYDALGRVSDVSEPGSSSLWNTTQYDIYGRIKSQILATGKTINYTYNGLVTTVNDGTKTVTTTRDAMGNVTKVEDPGGTITYTYYGNGAMKSSSYGGITQIIEQDGWGRKTKLTDPSAGVYTYAYNGFGEITKETTPKGTTTHTYDVYGKVLTTATKGDQTDMTTQYAYDTNTKLLKTITANDTHLNNSYVYTYGYDSYQRPITLTERANTNTFEKGVSYDRFGRVEEEIFTINVNGIRNSIKSSNGYDTASGIPNAISVTDGLDPATTVWKLNKTNRRGQATEAVFGNEMVSTMQYDGLGFATIRKDVFVDGNTTKVALDNTYKFDPVRGNLLNRSQLLSPKEVFNYDSQDRLITTRLTDAAGVTISSTQNTYDNSGRFDKRDEIGAYRYKAGDKRYQLKEIALNTTGETLYENRARQQVTYNAFKKPVEVIEKGKGRVSFAYGPMMNRTHAWYGGEQEDKTKRRYHKYYSSIMPVEVVQDTQNNTHKIITYIGGDAYNAPMVDIKENSSPLEEPTGGIYYLHRDHLGSILAISDREATVVEQRHFDAWGTVDAFTTNGTEQEFTYANTLLGRGYTGHEHFTDIRLIHMNGRMYDPQLGRFLSPDNYIQNPYDTQSYNRYGYVLNNPLKYTDPSGEILVESAVGGYYAVAGAIMLGSAIADALQPYNIGEISSALGSTFDGLNNAIGEGFQNLGDTIGSGIKDLLSAPISALSSLFGRGRDRGRDRRSSPAANVIPPQSLVSDPMMTSFAGVVPVMFSSGAIDGVLGGAYSTFEGLKQHFSAQGFSGRANLIAIVMGGNSIQQWNKIRSLASAGYDQTVLIVSNVSSYVANIPNMSSYDIGYGLGFGFEKAAEIALVSRGAGLMNAARGGQTIVGEGMKRVSTAAMQNPGSTILNNMPKFSGSPHQVTSQMMQYNRKWLLQQMRSGKPIKDIGLDPRRGTPSIFYQMEQNMIRNYLKLHPNAFQIIK